MSNYFLCYIFTFLFGASLWPQDFVVGTTSAYAPYVSLTDEGEYVGFDIDIAKEVSQKLARNLVIKDLGSMPALFLALKQGKIDACIWAISITNERQKQMTMIYYQGEKVQSLPLLFWKKIPDDVSSLQDLAESSRYVVAVEAGSFQDSFLQKTPNLNLKYVDKVMDAILEIKYGKSTATLIDPSLLAGFQAKFPEIKTLEIPLPPDEQSFGNGICLNLNQKALIDDVTKAVSDLRNEGKIADLEQKWNLGGK
jgi:arginine transport system substrate-binding protein